MLSVPPQADRSGDRERRRRSGVHRRISGEIRAPGPKAAAILGDVVKAMAEDNKLIARRNDPVGGYPASEFTIEDSRQGHLSGPDCSYRPPLHRGDLFRSTRHELGKRFPDSFAVAK
jgi:hypothetical protein